MRSSVLLVLLAVLACASALTVHLVPHSHDDVGWQITVDQYYQREVHNILDTVVASLQANPARRFIYVEQAFFQRWWRLQNDTQRSAARRLVASGQLEMVNGGWCMHDEAGTHYVDMVDQTTLGHRYISQQFGVQPTVTWQIDPFGHSATQAALFGPLSGMDAVFFARIDYQDRALRLASKRLEMLWRSSPSLGEAAQSFAGAFAPGFGYGPPTGFCWDRGCRVDPIQSNRSLPGYNLDTFVQSFVETAERQANMTLGDTVMWTMGNDFAYQQAETYFHNLDQLIDGVNADGRVKALYSTPSIYLAAKHAENLTWPLKTDDFVHPQRLTHTHHHRSSLHSCRSDPLDSFSAFVLPIGAVSICQRGRRVRPMQTLTQPSILAQRSTSRLTRSRYLPRCACV